MKKTAIVLGALALCLSCMACSAKAAFKISKTTDGEETEYDYHAEFSSSSSMTFNTDVDNKTADENDELINYVLDDDVMYVNAPNNDVFWWEVVGDTNTIKVLGWDVDKGVYYATCDSIIKEGTGYVIFGRYIDPDKEPMRYVVLEVEIKKGIIQEVTDTAVVDDLDDYFQD